LPMEVGPPVRAPDERGGLQVVQGIVERRVARGSSLEVVDAGCLPPAAGTPHVHVEGVVAADDECGIGVLRLEAALCQPAVWSFG
jgi:hypothetical protein